MFRKLLMIVAAVGMLAVPFATTAAPASADTVDQCAGGNPGYEYHQVTETHGTSGVYIASVRYEWYDDCHQILQSPLPHASLIAFGGANGWTPCIVTNDRTGGFTAPYFYFQHYFMNMAAPGHSCSEDVLTKVGQFSSIVQAGDGVSRDDMLFDQYASGNQCYVVTCYPPDFSSGIWYHV